MNNEALLRRIAAATEAQRRSKSEAQAAQAPQRAVLSPAPPQPKESHLDRIVTGQQPLPREVPQPRPVQTTTPNGTVPAGQAQPNTPQQMQAAIADRMALRQQAPQPAPPQPQQAQPAPMQAQSLDDAPSHHPEDGHEIAAQAEPAQTVQEQPIAPPNSEPTEPPPGYVDLVVEEEAVEVGYLISCDGTTATIEAEGDASRDTLAVGRMVTIPSGRNRVVGLVYRLYRPERDAMHIHVDVELQGEIVPRWDGSARFQKGICRYPGIGSVVRTMTRAELVTLYENSGTLSTKIGSLAQDATIDAYIDVEPMLSKHFAILGSTGCGKSSAVSLLLRKCKEQAPDLRTIILDPHDEYASAFPEATRIDARTLAIPFWMFHLEEFAETIFRGKQRKEEEVNVLRELIPEARQKFREDSERVKLRTEATVLTADTPVPYRMSDLLSLIDDEIGLLEARFDRGTLKALKARLVAQGNDPRYRFMYRDKSITDRSEEIIDQLFNIHGYRDNVTVLMMSELPSEVVNVLASVLCRLSFELCIAGHGLMKSLVVCEEAHRYIPQHQGGFEPSRRAVARIAKEGRKYGCFIAIVSQRPAELDATILSQCSTIFCLRLANDDDQDIIRKAISSASKSSVTFLSSLANREAIAFGEALLAPMRLKFETLPDHHLPGKDRDAFADVAQQTDGSIGHAFAEWRRIRTGLGPRRSS